MHFCYTIIKTVSLQRSLAKYIFFNIRDFFCARKKLQEQIISFHSTYFC